MNTTTTGFFEMNSLTLTRLVSTLYMLLAHCFEMNSLTLTRLVSTLYILLAHCFGPGVARYRGLCQERDLE